MSTARTDRIPLFPLGTVLFPGLVLPLHVFEDRYRLMVRTLLERPETERRFGVVAIRQGREVGSDGVRALYPVGCTAVLRRVDPLPDGRFEIVATGGERFRLLELDTSLPYAQGEIVLLDERRGDADVVVAGSVARAFTRYRAALSGGGLAALDDGSEGQPTDQPADLPEDPRALSYLVGAAMVLDLPDQQRLLEQPSVGDRLRAELALLRREAALLRALPSLPAVDLVRQGVVPN
ncbi:MAG TPA: LON peptidase substrate-binding domain-containing protein [Motilibacteraceae bacterium]|nr:LON peptidase substrate-binding domain-containing protein [Motilibacteraceae bacterium]